MSYILDALRKSDAQRRLGQVPDLDSGSSSAHVQARPRRRGLWLASIIALVLVAAAVALSLTQTQPREFWRGLVGSGGDGDTPTETGPETAPVTGEQSPVSETTEEPSMAVGSEPESPASEAAAESEARGLRRISRPAPQPHAPPVVPEGERERLVESAEEAQQLIEAEKAASARAEARRLLSQREDPEAPETAASADAVTTPRPVEQDESSWAPEAPEFVEVWDLPLSVRRELPDLNLSIHVFSADPGGRFVLINGERRLEGEDLGEGASLAEIRREGALIDFRDYRFLLKP